MVTTPKPTEITKVPQASQGKAAAGGLVGLGARKICLICRLGRRFHAIDEDIVSLGDVFMKKRGETDI